MNRFPRTIFIKQNTIQQQMPVITGELKEVYDEFLAGQMNYHNVAVELNDMKQAIDTALEILKEQKGVDLDQAEKDMLEKNDVRSYYEK